MKEFIKERKTLVKQNTRIDAAINLLSAVKMRDTIKGTLLDSAREVKTVIANVVRLIDGC